MTRYYYDDEDYIEDAYSHEHNREDDQDYAEEYQPPQNDVAYYDTKDRDRDYDFNEEYEQSNHKDSHNEPIMWAKIRMFNQTLDVCSKGMVRKSGDLFYCMFEGIHVPGTPYRYVPIEDEKGYVHRILMHEIVWKAFHGEVPDGWEVRHKQWVPMEYTKTYPNDIHHLDIYPKLSTAIDW